MGEAVYTLSEAVRRERATAIELKMAAALAKWPSDVEPDETPKSVILTLAEAKAIRVALSDADKWHASQRFAAQVDALAARTEASANSPEIPDSSIPAIQAGDVEAVTRIISDGRLQNRQSIEIARTILALRPAPPAGDVGSDGKRFWLVLKEPGCVPVRKGSWPLTFMKAVLREFMAANPTAYIDVLTIDHDGPQIEHGPQALQMLDGRSMSTGAAHNRRTREAHAPHHAALSAVPPAEGAKPKKTMTVKLTDEEMAVLDALAEKSGKEPPTIFRDSFRITREWFERKAALESDLEIGAGFELLSPLPAEPSVFPVGWTGSGSLSALSGGKEGFIFPTREAAHPIALYTHPQPQGLTREEVARALAASYGNDPDEDAPLSVICTNDNQPLPWWHAFTEQADAILSLAGEGGGVPVRNWRALKEGEKVKVSLEADVDQIGLHGLWLAFEGAENATFIDEQAMPSVKIERLAASPKAPIELSGNSRQLDTKATEGGAA